MSLRLLKYCFCLFALLSTSILHGQVVNLDSMVVVGKRHTNTVELKNLNSISLNVENSKQLPSILGNNDLIFISKLLPGIATNSNLDAGIYIRGGETSHTNILLNNATIYNPFHLFGLFSTFNTDHIENATITKNAVDAKYGNRLIGAFDFNTPQSNCKDLHYNVRIGLIDGQIHLSTPISSKSSLFVSARKSYIPTMFITSGLKYTFDDYNLTVVNEPNKNNTLIWNVYTGSDRLVFPDVNSGLNLNLDWDNLVSSLIWKTKLKKGTLEQTLYYSNYHDKNALSQFQSYTKFSFSINDIGYKIFYNHDGDKVTWQIGDELVSHHTEIHSPLIFDYLNIGVRNNSNLNQNSFENGLYANLSWHISKLFQLNSGLRYCIYQQAEFNRQSIEPRAELEYNLNPTSKFSLAYSRHYQYTLEIPLSHLSLPMNYWICSDKNFLPQNSDLLSFDYLKRWNNISLNTSLFYTRISNLKEKELNILDLISKDVAITDEVYNGKRNCYGFELLLKYNSQRLAGWISYTYSHSRDKFKEINDGLSFPSPHNRTHTLNISGTYNLSKRVDASFNFVYATGLPYTAPTNVYMLNENVVFDFGKYNGSSMPRYHRLDVSINYKLHAKPGHSKYLNFSVYDIYAHRNPIIAGYKAKYFKDKNTLFVFKTMKAYYRIIPSISYIYNF
jgi:hypothetical protein